jgi:hypothetical protein
MIIGLACAAALGEGWFMAVFIPVLLTAFNLSHWRAARRGHGPARPANRRAGHHTAADRQPISRSD